MPSYARFRTLSYFYFYRDSAVQIVPVNAESTRSNLDDYIFAERNQVVVQSSLAGIHNDS